ncbi:hypothetical protein CSUI_002524 [Cystoisospora suis]|uniref:Tetratricopeptide repeat-containing protein n=1 Tax=Cystoisospora suis TaxID=483139 RepID=A0A2C6L950_9APIC|nr:hypothetical protein CSUI_002524 [Cystoisospora suis]
MLVAVRLPDTVLRAELLGATHNNLLCLLLSQGRFVEAAEQAEKLTELQNIFELPSLTRAVAHLNVCSLFCRRKLHQEALQHALYAVGLLQHLTEDPVAAQNPGFGPAIRLDLNTYDFSGLRTAVVSAYYSVAVQQEYLGEIERAARNYNVACQAAARRLHHGDPLSTFVRNALASFRTSLGQFRTRTAKNRTLLPALAGTGSLRQGRVTGARSIELEARNSWVSCRVFESVAEVSV